MTNFKELLDSFTDAFKSSTTNDQQPTDTITQPTPERLTEAFLTRIISTQAVATALTKLNPDTYANKPTPTETDAILFRYHLIQALTGE